MFNYIIDALEYLMLFIVPERILNKFKPLPVDSLNTAGSLVHNLHRTNTFFKKRVMGQIKNLKIGDSVKVGRLWPCMPTIRAIYIGKVIGWRIVKSTHPRASTDHIVHIEYDDGYTIKDFEFTINRYTDWLWEINYINGEIVLIDD